MYNSICNKRRLGLVCLYSTGLFYLQSDTSYGEACMAENHSAISQFATVFHKIVFYVYYYNKFNTFLEVMEINI